MSTAIFYDLAQMIRRAFRAVYDGCLTQEFVDFIRECQAFQYDILRPWDRID
jgi:hypothetical protein